MKSAIMRVGLVLLLSCAAAFSQEAPAPVAVPSLSANLGSCTAEFTVLGADGKPIYNAKVHVLLRYGAMSLHKLDLEVSTNNDGQARIEGLPAKMKGMTVFDIRQGDRMATVPFRPTEDCHPKYTVKLEEKGQPEPKRK